MMFKKMLLLAILVGGVVVGLKAVRNNHIGSAIRTEVEEIQDWARSKVPFEKKIASLRKEVRAMDRDIEKAANELAREIVEVRMLTREVEDMRASLDREAKTLEARGNSIKDGTEKVSVGRISMSVAEAKDQLKADVARHIDRKRTLSSTEKVLTTRERIKASLETQLETLKKKKLEVAAAIDSAEAKFKELQLQQMESKYQHDDTRLSKIKDELRQLNKDLDIKSEALKLAPAVYEDGQAVKVSTGSESVDEILAPVTGKKADKETIERASE